MKYVYSDAFSLNEPNAESSSTAVMYLRSTSENSFLAFNQNSF